MISQKLTDEQKTLLNIGKICGWVESSGIGDNFRYSIAKLAFELNKADFTKSGDAARLLSCSEEKDFSSRFISIFMTPPSQASCSAKLQEAHQRLFSHKEGLRYHPGTWRNSEHPKLIDDFVADLDHNTPPFSAAVRIHKFVSDLRPFDGDNGPIAVLAPNFYLQTLGVVPYPLFTFHRIPSDADADRWFAVQSERMVRILHNINRLNKTYQERTNGLAKQRKDLLKDILPYMMRRPKFGIPELLDDFGKSNPQTLGQLANTLSESPISILEETTGFSRFRVFHLHEYTKLFEELI